MKVGDKVLYLDKSQMFPYDHGTVVAIEVEWSGNIRCAVDFRPAHKAERFWVWEDSLRILSPLEEVLE